MKNLIFLLFITLVACTNQEIKYHSMVVSAHPEATKIGIDVLKNGGNAIDAAVAVEFALAVCYHSAGNIGGGGFMVYRSADGKYDALDFRETAPLKAYRDMYLDEERNVISRLSLDGGLAAGVPGSVDGIFTKHEKYGSLDMKQLIQYSIDLARNGFTITEKQAYKFNNKRAEFDKVSPNNNYLRQQKEWKQGDILIQEDFAKTLERIKENGRAGFYEGKTAEAIVKSIQHAGGIMSLEDLKQYHSVWRKPIIGHFNQFKFISMAPPSSGGIALFQLLNMLEQKGIDTLKHNSAAYIHLITEAERRVYADRNTHLGDPEFNELPLDKMKDSLYILSRMANYNPDYATRSTLIKAGDFEEESEETTHFSIVDKYGAAVSITTTLNSSYGSKLFVDGCGFLLNNEMDDFSSKPGIPNQYGLIGTEANAIEPNKRMLSSMTPTIIEENGNLRLVVGSPGGSTIITSVLQNILNVTLFDMDIQSSVDAPRFHHQWLPDLIYFEENRFDSTLFKSLINIGHNIKERSSIGRVDAILVQPDGSLKGGADSRGDDFKLGLE